jgi:small RNA 2'-O-methyltransferase
VNKHDFSKITSHSDHKFEWTPEEWTTFFTESASKFGYAVEVGGVGLAVEPDPWNREDNLGYASQVALFRRLDSSAPQAGCLDHVNFATMPRHVLLARHVHELHPLSLKELALPPNLDQVREAVKEVMSDNSKRTLTFNEIWSHGAISLRCKGDVGALVRAFEVATLDPDTWLVDDETEAWETRVTWKKFGVSNRVVCSAMEYSRATSSRDSRIRARRVRMHRCLCITTW